VVRKRKDKMRGIKGEGSEKKQKKEHRQGKRNLKILKNTPKKEAAFGASKGKAAASKRVVRGRRPRNVRGGWSWHGLT